MPMLITVVNGAPLEPRITPSRTLVGERQHALAFGEHLACDGLAARARPRTTPGTRSAVCSTARPSVVLMGSPRHMASMRARRPAASARLASRRRPSSSMRWREKSR